MAVSEQAPPPTSVTVVPDTVQIELAEVVPKVNEGLGALEVAESETGPEPNTTLAGIVLANAMVWVAGVTVKLWFTAGAAEKVVLPAWLA